MSESHEIHSEILTVWNRQAVQFISPGCRHSAQAIAAQDNGPGKASSPVCQPLVQGCCPKQLGVLMALDGLQEGLLPLIDDHAKVLIRIFLD